MRIGLVIYGSLDTLSGGYLYDRQLVAHLRGRGDTVDIISQPWVPYAMRPAHNLVPAYRTMMERGYDLLLQDELNHPSLAWVNERLNPRPPIVSIVHHLRVSERHRAALNALYGRVERRYLRSVDAFIYNSQTTRAAVEGMTGESRPHVVAYPAGDRLSGRTTDADLARWTADGPLRLLFVGNLIPRKGLHTLIQALSGLAGDWMLDVVGSHEADAAYARQMVAEVGGRGLSDRVRFFGDLPDSDLAGLMARSYLLVVPSQYEGFGIVYLEAMAFGLPCIATTAGAAREIITDGVNGYLVPPDDPAALASRLALLNADRALLARLSVEARRRFERHPTWAETTADIRTFLQELIS